MVIQVLKKKENQIPLDNCLVRKTFAVPENPPQIHLSSIPVKKMSGTSTKKDMIINSNDQMMNIKIEENHDLPKIRKKICRKMLSIFTDEFNIDKKDAKK